VQFVVPPLGASRLRMLAALQDVANNTHGDHAIALRGVILVYPSRRFVRPMLSSIGGYFA
jgi:hypothetical protein